jgi:hypothetical protein
VALFVGGVGVLGGVDVLDVLDALEGLDVLEIVGNCGRGGFWHAICMRLGNKFWGCVGKSRKI